jgi:hypothetical protein
LAVPLGSSGNTSSSFNEEEELGVNDYARFINDTKNILVEYAEKNDKKEILERASQLVTGNKDLKSDLNMLLVLLKAEQQ